MFISCLILLYEFIYTDLIIFLKKRYELSSV